MRVCERGWICRRGLSRRFVAGAAAQVSRHHWVVVPNNVSAEYKQDWPNKMSVDSAHRRQWEIAEVIFGIPFLISIALQFLVPFSLPQGILRQVLVPIGIVLIIIGVGLIVLARRELAHYGQPTDPGHPTSKVVQTGVFAISRNPLYLASVMVFFGIALTLNILWALVTLLASIVLCHYILIIPEEKYLAAKFSKEYEEYVASVHRWFGRK
jgi:protein-S-isoprenylcysteine O-methyltransferase Ste14